MNGMSQAVGQQDVTQRGVGLGAVGGGNRSQQNRD
jgi:hypothetical protein